MSASHQPNFRQFVPLLFLPAGIGILFRTGISVGVSMGISMADVPIGYAPIAYTSVDYAPLGYAPLLSAQLLALALLLFCFELARMAKVDLDNVVAVATQLPAQRLEDSQLSVFYKIVVSTIVLESLGFYLATVSLPLGGLVVIFSQVWFNLLAKVQLFPHEAQSIISFGLLERLPVLLANAAGLVLLALWPMREIRLWLSTGLLILIVLFLLIKYVLPILFGEAEQKTSEPCPKDSSGD